MSAMYTQLRFVLLLSALLSVASGSNAQISITGSGFTYGESFSTNAVPSGWDFFETGANANTSFSTGTGTSTTGDTYFLGSSDYAFGGLQSGNLVPTVGVCFTNNSGKTLTDISVSYVGETWRVGAANRSDRMDFQLNTNTTAINGSGTWSNVDALDYANPGQATGSGSVQHTATISNTLSGLSIANGSTFCMRWLDFNAAGADDAMGIASFNITSIVLPIELSAFHARANGKRVDLDFSTANERNNAFFIIERSADGVRFENIGQVKGAGDSDTPRFYTFSDEHPLAGKNYYRLRQVDLDGKLSFSKIATVRFGSATDFTLSPVPTADRLLVSLNEPMKEDGRWQVFDLEGRLVLEGVFPAELEEQNLDVLSLPEATYVLRLIAGQEVQTRKFRKIR